MRQTTTPLAGAFFKMVIVGAVAGTVITAALTFLDRLSSWPLNIPAMLVPATFGFFIGMAIAGSAAGCAIGLHAWAAAKNPELRLPAGALGGAIGPIFLSFALFGPPWQAPVPPLVWAIILPACSLVAVHFTRPLRWMQTDA